MKILLRMVLGVASVGWLVPAYFSISWLFASLQVDSSSNSFPYRAESEKMFDVAFPWFVTVVLMWAALALVPILRKLPLRNAPAAPDA